MSCTSSLEVTLMAARLPCSFPWGPLMLAVIVASLTLSASCWFDVVSLVLSSRASRLVRAAIIAWVSWMLAACAVVGVMINVATVSARTTRGVDRVVPRRRTRIMSSSLVSVFAKLRSLEILYNALRLQHNFRGGVAQLAEARRLNR